MKARIAATLAALLFPLQCLATYVFNTVDYPGAVSTTVWGINSTGQIVGSASLDGTSVFSFRYSGGVFTVLPPTIYQVGALGINDAGVIIGGANLDPGPEQGFIFNAGSYAFFTHPGWASTEARAISNSNLITGFSADAAFSTSIGWIYNPLAGTFTDISIPGSFLTIAQGINAAGQVVGSAILPGGTRAFLREPSGTLTLFQIGAAPTRARAINDNGLIAGWMTVGGVNQSFVATSGGFETLVAPGASSTFAEGLNNAGQVSGLYITTSGGVETTHGFIATPASMPTGTTSSGAYTFSVAVIPNFPIFIDPAVAIGFDYDIGRGDPRFATVRLPIGIGDNIYRVKVQGRKFTVAGGELLDFRTHGFPAGVAAFRVGCIDVGAGVDPANPQAFPTELTFMAAGTFTGTMKPIARSDAHGDMPQCDD